jgi:hypothetical protein
MRMSARFLAILALPLVLSACTETKFLDTIGAGKTSPDETAVQPNRQLSMPPDLNLPAPADADMNIAVNNPAAPAAPAATVATTTPPAVAAPQSNSPIVPGTNMTFDQQQDQLYARYGVNKLKADGTPKTFDELQAELKAAVVAEKKAANPNYGTIWNLGEWFK